MQQFVILRYLNYFSAVNSCPVSPRGHNKSMADHMATLQAAADKIKSVQRASEGNEEIVQCLKYKAISWSLFLENLLCRVLR